ncbi:MAG: hypothetical protein M3Z06_02475 [Actinomycetota bacterium]|nr:hypothetical protein [Actinomycetota bacterium]
MLIHHEIRLALARAHQTDLLAARAQRSRLGPLCTTSNDRVPRADEARDAALKRSLKRSLWRRTPRPSPRVG